MLYLLPHSHPQESSRQQWQWPIMFAGLAVLDCGRTTCIGICCSLVAKSDTNARYGVCKMLMVTSIIQYMGTANAILSHTLRPSSQAYLDSPMCRLKQNFSIGCPILSLKRSKYEVSTCFAPSHLSPQFFKAHFHKYSQLQEGHY